MILISLSHQLVKIDHMIYGMSMFMLVECLLILLILSVIVINFLLSCKINKIFIPELNFILNTCKKLSYPFVLINVIQDMYEIVLVFVPQPVSEIRLYQKST